jgi:hypothetical protein
MAATPSTGEGATPLAGGAEGVIVESVPNPNAKLFRGIRRADFAELNAMLLSI